MECDKENKLRTEKEREPEKGRSTAEKREKYIT
jgi:hypothetical protein